MRIMMFVVMMMSATIFAAPIPTATELATNLLTQVEGFRAKKYWDHNQYSIGYGTKAMPSDTTITKQIAKTRLQSRVTSVSRVIDRDVKVKLTVGQKAALISFVYNVGENAFRKSTLLKKLNAGNKKEVPAELRKWTFTSGKKSEGLVQRRAKEIGLWLQS